MLRSFDSLAVRQMRTRRLRALLTTFGIVLGVGMVFGVMLLTGTIHSTFDKFFGSIYGNTDVVVSGPPPRTLPGTTLDTVRSVPGVKEATGDVFAGFTLLDERGEPVEGARGRLNVAAFPPRGADIGAVKVVSGREVTDGPEITVGSEWARRNSVDVGERIRVATPTGVAQLHVVGLVDYTSGLSFGDQGFGRMGVAEARRLMDKPAAYDEIRIVADDKGKVDELRRRIEAVLGPGPSVDTPSSISQQVGDELKSLDAVLYMFSGVALFVGGFLILNSFSMTVLQRMRELGMLRTMGASRGMIVRSVLTEAALLGGVGTVLGLGLGIGLALGLISLMEGLGLPVGGLEFTVMPLIVATALGIVVSVLGALRPARRAGRVQPIAAVLATGEVRRKADLRSALIGLVLFLPGLLLGGLYWFGNEFDTSSTLGALLGISGTIAMFAGMAMLAPLLITPVVAALSAPLRRIFPTSGRLASDAARNNPVRTAATAAMLMIGLSVVVVNGTMTASFLGSINDQIDRSLASVDLTVQPLGAGSFGGPATTITRGLEREVGRLPQTETATPVQTLLVNEGLPEAGHGNRLIVLVGVDPKRFPQVDETPIQGAPRADAFRALARGGGVILTKAYAKQIGLDVGDPIVLRGPVSTRTARVAGLMDTMAYGGARVVQMSTAAMSEIYGVNDSARLLIRARSEADRPALESSIKDLLDREHPDLEVLSNAEVKDRLETQVNQQFSFFNAIVAMAVIVSLLGIINTLAMSVIERTREIGLLRALGSSRWLVRQTILDESLLITIAGSLVGIAMGTLIGWVWVLGLESSLPGIAFHFPVATAILVGIAGVVLGVLASILPARRAARTSVISALSYE